MKAARLHKVGEPLRIEEVPMPQIGPTDVLVKVMACGICGSDIHTINGGVRISLPRVLGHEPAGVITEVGETVVGLKVGDRVCVHTLVTCGQCLFCLKGREYLCRNLRTIGGHLDGALAQYLKAPAGNLFRLPEEIPFDEGAIMTDAVTATFHAVSLGEVKPSDVVVIFGIGGLGINAVQFAKLFGAKVIAVDRNDVKLEMARAVGADETINMAKTNPVKGIRAVTNGEGADVAIEAIGLDKTIQQAIECLRAGGKAILVGICPTEVQIKPLYIVMKGIEIKGTPYNRRQDFPTVIEMVRSGKIDLSKSISHRVSLDEVNKGIEILQKRIGNPLRVVVMVE